MFRTLLSLVLLLTEGPVCRAEEPPAAGTARLLVHDETRLLSEEERAALELELGAMEHDTGVVIRLHAAAFLDGQSVRDYASALANQEKAPALAIVFVRGNSQTAIMASAELWRRHPADALALLLTEAGRVLANQFLPPEKRMKEAAALAIARLRSLESQRAADLKFLGRAEKRLVLVLSGGLGIAAIIGILVVVIRRRRSLRADGFHLFPEAAVGTRLGAPFGGGPAGQADSGRAG